MKEQQYPAEFLEYLRLYRDGEYYECHEVLEGLWHRTRSDFHKGMIQVAVTLYQLRRHNLVGAHRMLTGSYSYLKPFCPWHQGVCIDPLLVELADRLQWVRSALKSEVDPADPAAKRPFSLQLAPDLATAAGWPHWGTVSGQPGQVPGIREVESGF